MLNVTFQSHFNSLKLDLTPGQEAVSKHEQILLDLRNTPEGLTTSIRQ